MIKIKNYIIKKAPLTTNLLTLDRAIGFAQEVQEPVNLQYVQVLTLPRPHGHDNEARNLYFHHHIIELLLKEGEIIVHSDILIIGLRI